MRLQRGTPVAGVDPQTARTIARACHGGWCGAEAIADRLRLPVETVEPWLRWLEDGGCLQRRTAAWSDEAEEWNTTLDGGALTMASFLKPISRARAERLLAGVLERAAQYNADHTKPYVITEIAVFGSYLRPDVTELGDLDLALHHASRRPEFNDPDVLLEYAHASGRTFATFIDRLAWPQEELVRLLRNRSGYINVHTEDVSRFTKQATVVYEFTPQPVRPTDPDAPSPHAWPTGQ